MGDTLVVLLIVLVAAIIWRGPKNIPKIGAMLGRGVKEARDAARGDDAKDDGPKPG